MINRKQLFFYIKQFWIALRPFSLTLAFSSTSYGILAAKINGTLFTGTRWQNWLVIILVTIAGLASQAGANLVNDYFEGSFKYSGSDTKTIKFLGRQRSYFDVFVFLTGLAVLGLAGLIGIYLIYISNIWMLVIGLTGLIGSYAYTGEPFVYKRKGLGVPLSFLLMGPLMTLGAYFPFTKTFSLTPILLSLPGSLLIPALMISNEMRDFKRDHKLSLGTLSVRIGSFWSTRLFEMLLILMYGLTITFVILKLFPVYALFSLITLPLAVSAWNHVRKFERLSIPSTNRLHMAYNVIILLCLLIWGGDA